MRSQDFSGKWATGGGVNLLEQKCLRVRRENCGSAGYDARRLGRRKRAGIRIEGLHRLCGRKGRRGSKPDTHRTAGAKKCRGRVASTGQIVSEETDLFRKRSPGSHRVAKRIGGGSGHEGGGTLFSRVYDYFLIFGTAILQRVVRAGTT